MNKAFVVNDSAGRAWSAQLIQCPVCGADSNRKLFKLVKSRCSPKRPEDTFVRCNSCGLVYINPRILFPLEPIAEPSEKVPVDIDLDANARLADYELQEDLERIFKYKPKGYLLEVGCGTGAFLSLAREAGYQTRGVEPREDYVAYARDRFGLDVIQGLVGDPRQSIELPDDEFDVVVMTAVLEHLLDVRRVVQSVHRSLRLGGIFYLTTPDVDSLSALLHGPRWGHYHICWHHQFFSKHTLQRLLTQQGFHILETWGVYRGRPIRWRRLVKQALAATGISLDVIAVLAEKVR